MSNAYVTDAVLDRHGPHPFPHCDPCQLYVERRRPVLGVWVIEAALQQLEPPAAVLTRLLRGVHARHQAGLPILPPHPEAQALLTADGDAA